MKKIAILLICVTILSVGAWAAEFVPRLTAPDKNNPYYTTLNVFHIYGYGMEENGGNCTCYAYGRAYEILGKAPRLSTGSAGKWYDYNMQNSFYQYGSEPALGAIAVWKSAVGGAGHVAVVEKISGDIVTTSESGWNSYYFKTVQRNKNHKNFGANDKYIFQGFIYVYELPYIYAEATSKKAGSVAEITIDVKNTESCTVVVSSYKNGKLFESKFLSWNGDKIVAKLDSAADSYKVIITDKNDITTPICTSVQLR